MLSLRALGASLVTVLGVAMVVAPTGACSMFDVSASPCTDASPLICPNHQCCPTGYPFQCKNGCYASEAACTSGYTFCSLSGGSSQLPALAAVSQPSGTFGALMVSKKGETFTPIVSRDAAGNASRVTGVVYTSKTDVAITVHLGDDGRPTDALMGGYVLLFSGWNATSGTVDIAKIYVPSGRIDILRGVPNPAATSPTGHLSAQGAALDLHPDSLCFPTCDKPQKNLADALKLAAFAFSAGACVAGSAASLGAMALPCTGMLVEGATLLVGDEPWLEQMEGAGLVLAAIGCSHANAAECVSLATSFAGNVLGEAEATRTASAPLFDQARGFLADPSRTNGTSSGGAAPTCARYECNPGAYMPCYPDGTKQCASDCTWSACPSASSGGCAETPNCASGTHQEGCSCVANSPSGSTSCQDSQHYSASCPDGTKRCCSRNMVCCHDSANGGAIGCEFSGFCE